MKQPITATYCSRLMMLVLLCGLLMCAASGALRAEKVLAKEEVPQAAALHKSSFPLFGATCFFFN